jgi:hypothetical protein
MVKGTGELRTSDSEGLPYELSLPCSSDSAIFACIYLCLGPPFTLDLRVELS